MPFTKKYKFLLTVVAGIVILTLVVAKVNFDGYSPIQTADNQTENDNQEFDGDRAFQDVVAQVEFGPRTPNSVGHQLTVDYITNILRASNWEIEIQETSYQGHNIKNIIAKRSGKGAGWLLLGAHYDTRMISENDPDPNNYDVPGPGANDGAAAVSVLLELARVLPNNLDQEVWLVFFDAEDNGRIPGYDWAMGSRVFVDSLSSKPSAVVIVDMIGDADLNIHFEKSSTVELNQRIWQIANDLEYSQFIPTEKYSMLDDHTAFVQQGIPTALLIDFDYPYWHTLADTPDKVSPESLKAVGDTLLTWILQYPYEIE